MEKVPEREKLLKNVPGKRKSTRKCKGKSTRKHSRQEEKYWKMFKAKEEKEDLKCEKNSRCDIYDPEKI